MAHAVAANNGAGNFHSAFFANNIFVADTAVFSAITFKVFLRAENPFVEKAASLAAAGSIINRLRLGHFTVRPLADALRRGDADYYLIKIACVYSIHTFIVGC